MEGIINEASSIWSSVKSGLQATKRVDSESSNRVSQGSEVKRPIVEAWNPLNTIKHLKLKDSSKDDHKTSPCSGNPDESSNKRQIKIGYEDDHEEDDYTQPPLRKEKWV